MRSYISLFFPRKKTPQHHSNTPQCLDCRRSAIATLHQRLAHWRSATRPRKWHKCWSYEAYEETLEKLQSTPHSTSCSMIFFIFFLLNLLNELFSDFLMYSPNSLNARLLWRCPQAAEGVPRPSLRSRTIGQHHDFVPVQPTIGMITPTWFKSIESQKLPKTFTVSHSGVALGCSVLGNAVPSSKSNKHVWEYPNLWELQHHGYTSINLIPTAPPSTVRAWHPKFDTPKLSE